MKSMDLTSTTFCLHILFLIVFPVSTLDVFGKNDWPHYRGPNYDGITDEKIPQLKEFKLLWQVNVNIGFSSITVVDGCAYTMGNKDNVDSIYCLDTNSGKKIWEYKYSCKLRPKSYEGGPNATPTIYGGKVYTLSKEGHVFCLDAKSGNVLWSRHAQEDFNALPPSWGFAGSPTIVENKVILNVGSAGLALNKDTGKEIWSSEGKLAGYSSPLPYRVGERKGIAFFNAKELISVDSADGTKLWSYKWKTFMKINVASPVLFQKYMFISSGYNEGCSVIDISLETPKEIWTNKELRNQFSSSVLRDGYLFGIDGNVGRRNKLKCINLINGELLWSKKDFGFGSLILADDTLIILKDGGELVLVEARPDQYKENHRQKILSGKCWTVPTLSQGKLYARNAEGALVCMGFKADSLP